MPNGLLYQPVSTDLCLKSKLMINSTIKKMLKFLSTVVQSMFLNLRKIKLLLQDLEIVQPADNVLLLKELNWEKLRTISFLQLNRSDITNLNRFSTELWKFCNKRQKHM